MRIRLWVKITFIIIILTTGVTIYSKHISTKRINVKQYNIEDNNIPTNFNGLKIVHISDIHYKITIDNNQLNKITNTINNLNPDLIIITGDLLDKSVNYNDKDKNNLINFISNLNPNLGKYMITGDNDTNEELINYIISNTDIINLNDTYDLIYNDFNNPILIAGLSSNYDIFDENKLNSIYEFINTSDIKYKILIMHEPDFIDKIDYNKFNLILAGHTMGGNIGIPLIKNLFLPKYGKKYYNEHYTLNNTEIYINNGLGVSKFKFRLFNSPTLNFYRLSTKN